MTTGAGQSTEHAWGFEREEKAEIVKHWQLDAIMEHVKRIWASMQQDRGPQDFAPNEGDKVVRITRRELRHLMRFAVTTGKQGGPGSVNGSKSWIRDLAIGVILALTGWILLTQIQQGKDIARIQCQLSPSTCLQLVPNGK